MIAPWQLFTRVYSCDMQLPEDSLLRETGPACVAREKGRESEDFSPSLFISIQEDQTLVSCGSGKQNKEVMQFVTMDDATKSMVMDVLDGKLPNELSNLVSDGDGTGMRARPLEYWTYGNCRGGCAKCTDTSL